jgi:hypothetical protein
MRTRQTVYGIFAVLLLAGAGMTFAQEEPAAEAPEPAAPRERKNAITLDTIPLFKGFIASDSDADIAFFCIALAYERLLAPHFSIVPNLDLYFGKMGEDMDGDNIPYVYFSIVAEGRYYITEQMDKFFVGAMLGFNVQAIDGDSDEEDGGFAGPLIGVKVGYRALMGKVFFFEPSMSYTYSKTNAGLFGMTPQSIGWQAGLRLGVSF